MDSKSANKKLKKEFILEGIHCAGCAAKIENDIKKLDNVSSATLNFTTKILSIEIENIEFIDLIDKKSREIIKNHEPDLIVTERILNKSNKKTIYLMGLDCAHCAGKIETKVKTISGVKSSSLDFTNQKLNVEFTDKFVIDTAIDSIVKLIKEIEPDVNVIIPDNDTKSQDKNSFKTADKKNILGNKDIIRFIGSLSIFLLALFIPKNNFTVFLYLIAYLIGGYDVLIKAFKNILKGDPFDENFLMGIATIGAFFIGEYPEAISVMLFYKTGEFLQGIAVNRSRKAISSLMDIRPDYANLKRDNDIITVSPEDVLVNDIILIKPGEKFPLDGIIIDGVTFADTSAITGESVPKELKIGDNVLSGYINKNGVISVKVTNIFAESTVSKILEMVENASNRKSKTESFITKFARYYTPIVVFTALIIGILPPLFTGESFSIWIYRALIFLVVSCPCALVISVPLGYFAGLGFASKKGILIKGANYLEALATTDTIVFDKTGTLTQGVFDVIKVSPEDQKDELLKLAALAESFSNHPIATSIIKAYGNSPDKSLIEGYDEESGKGVMAKTQYGKIICGNSKIMEKYNINYKKTDEFGTIVHVALDEKYLGYMVISDKIKVEAKTTIESLINLGINNIIMLTGDNKINAEYTGEQIGIKKILSQLLPLDKVNSIENLEKTGKGKTIFVGDGINDAPVLARADIGIAMGGIGSDAAIEASDIVIMTDDLLKIPEAIKIAKKAQNIVWQNIVFSLGIKILVLILGAVGIATMWEAVFADVGVTLIAVLNSVRILNSK